LRKSGRAQNGLGVIAQQLLHFGVADNRHAARRAVLRACRHSRWSAGGSADR
jgi:hypothetical protein